MQREGRPRVESHGDGVRVTMPGPRGRWRVAALVLLAPIAAFVAVSSVVFVRATIESARAATPLGAAAVWAVGLLLLLLTDIPVLLALAVVLYHLGGTEIVCASPWMLADERRVLGILRYRRTWAALRVSEMRLSPMSGGQMDASLLGRRGVLFLVDGRHVRGMGEGCTPAEAAELLAAVDEALHRPTITR